MTILILLAIAVPVVGYLIARMENIDTGVRPSIKQGLYGAGGALTALGGGMFVIGALVWFFTVVTSTQSTWIDLQVVFYYSLVTAAVGGTMMGLSRPQQ